MPRHRLQQHHSPQTANVSHPLGNGLQITTAENLLSLQTRTRNRQTPQHPIFTGSRRGNSYSCPTHSYLTKKRGAKFCTSSLLIFAPLGSKLHQFSTVDNCSRKYKLDIFQISWISFYLTHKVTVILSKLAAKTTSRSGIHLR